MTVDCEQVNSAASALRAQWPCKPEVGIILGTGLGELADTFDVQARIDGATIPNLPRASAPGHRGGFVCGTLSGVPVVAATGRFHLYEGHNPAQVILPVCVMRELGVKLLVVSNACGGLNPNFCAGDIMVIADHIDCTWMHHAGISRDSMACRPVASPYDPHWADHALEIGRRHDITMHRGVYVGVVGPNYETRAEYRMFRRLGGDAVGMSTVHEASAASRLGMNVLALSVVTNICLPDRLPTADGQSVLAVAAAAASKVRIILQAVVQACAAEHR